MWTLPSSSPQVFGITSKIWLHVFCSEQSCLATRQLIAAVEGPVVTNPEIIYKDIERYSIHGNTWIKRWNGITSIFTPLIICNAFEMCLVLDINVKWRDYGIMIHFWLDLVLNKLCYGRLEDVCYISNEYRSVWMWVAYLKGLFWCNTRQQSYGCFCCKMCPG